MTYHKNFFLQRIQHKKISNIFTLFFSIFIKGIFFNTKQKLYPLIYIQAMSYETVIGLSFGNTSTSIAVENDGVVEVIANEDGERSIPSVLSYTGSDEWHGVQAKLQLIRNADNTVLNFRDFLTKSLKDIDPSYNHASAHPVEIEGGKIGFNVKSASSDDKAVVSVDEIIKRHLDRIRESAADYIGKPIDGAVLTVPTDFNQEQRNALVEIANQAKLNVMQIINEPTAALLAHVAERSANKTGSLESKVILVLDIGGTRTDGAVITNRGGMFNIIATQHDYELGGYHLDEELMKYFAKEFEKKHKIDPFKETRAVAKLRAESETVKKTLSNTTTANFAVESLASGIDFHMSINRLRFELLARPIFSRISSFVESLIKKAKLDVLQIDEVLLVGGSTFVPKVASTVAALFDPSVTNVVAPSLDTKAINPSEAVVRGAALQASLISIYEQNEIDESLKPVVTNAPHTTKPIAISVLNTEAKDENDSKTKLISVVDFNTPVPFKTTKVFEAPKDSENVYVAVYEGEPDVKVTVLEKPPKDETAKDEEEEEDSWDEDSDDEPEEVKSLFIKPTKLIAELGLEGVSKGGKIEVTVNITRDLKVQLTARELKAGGAIVRGELPAATLA